MDKGKRVKCVRCGKAFIWEHEYDHEDQAMCTPCWKYLTEAPSYKEFLKRRTPST